MKKYLEFINEKLNVIPEEFNELKFKVGDIVSRWGKDEYKIVNILKHIPSGDIYYMLEGNEGFFTPYDIYYHVDMEKDFILSINNVSEDIKCLWSSENGTELDLITHEDNDKYEEWDDINESDKYEFKVGDRVIVNQPQHNVHKVLKLCTDKTGEVVFKYAYDNKKNYYIVHFDENIPELQLFMINKHIPEMIHERSDSVPYFLKTNDTNCFIYMDESLTLIPKDDQYEEWED